MSQISQYPDNLQNAKCLVTRIMPVRLRTRGYQPLTKNKVAPVQSILLPCCRASCDSVRTRQRFGRQVDRPDSDHITMQGSRIS